MDDGPWRHAPPPPVDLQQAPMAWTNMAGGAGGGGQPWGHHSPQAAAARRKPWDPNTLADNLNEALGLSGGAGPPAGWPSVAPNPNPNADFGSQLWSDAHMGDPNVAAAHYGHMHPHPQGGMMNGMMEPSGVASGEWGMRGGADQQQLWSDPLKPDDGTGYWKQQQQQGGPGGPGGPGGWGQGGGGQGGPPRWPAPMGGPQHGPPPHRGAHMPLRPGGGWPGGPNGMMGGGNQGGPKPPMWANPDGAHRGMGGGGGMGGRGGPHRGGPGGGGYPRGMDMSVPPPMDMNMMRGGPPPGNQMWKPEGAGMGGPNGMRPAAGGYGGGAAGMQSVGGGAPLGGNFMGGGAHKPPQFDEEPIGKFSMTGAGGNTGGQSEDLMWHDPNGELKKWQRDTGVSVWGDPDKAALRNIQNWIVPENDEEDLESALTRCPVPQKRTESLQPVPGVPGDENTSVACSSSTPATPSTFFHSRLPPVPSGKRNIVVTGWGDLPDNDPNNPLKSEVGGAKWDEPSASDTAWFLPSNAPTPFGQDSAAAPWGAATPAGQPGAINVSRMLGAGGPGPHNQQNTEVIADQLRVAVEKGYLDMAVLTQQHLPPSVLAQMNSMLAKIPALDAAEARLEEFMESNRPPGEIDDAHPPSWMREEHKGEYNRLIIELTTAKIEVSDLSKKMQAALQELREQGQLPEQVPAQGDSAHDNYTYSFLG